MSPSPQLVPIGAQVSIHRCSLAVTINSNAPDAFPLLESDRDLRIAPCHAPLKFTNRLFAGDGLGPRIGTTTLLVPEHSMDLSIKWQPPIDLLDGDDQNLIYVANGLNDWMDVPGVYMFARIFNDQVSPLYIGKAEGLGRRAWQHFKKNTQLMNGIKKAPNGRKVLILGKFTAKPGQSTIKCIALVERALIDHALTEGHTLLNVQGTRAAFHTVNFSGNLGARHLTGKSLSFRAK